METLLWAVVTVLSIIVFSRLRKLQETVSRLQDEVAALRGRKAAAAAPVQGLPESAFPRTGGVVRAATPTPVTSSPISATPAPVQRDRAPMPIPPAPVPPSPLPPVIPERHAAEQPHPAPVSAAAGHPERRQWEALIGGNLFNYIGAIALFFGLAFLLKYAIDNNWITPPLRVLCGYVIGIGLLFAGHRFHRKGLPVFAQGVIGAGVAVCYLCGFAAYVPAVVGSPTAAPMVSYPVALLLMTLAAVLAFQQSLWYDALPVALLGWIGGLLTPFILHSGNTGLGGLYLYLLLFTAGMVAIAARKVRWLALEPMTLCAVYLIYLTFSFLSPSPALAPASSPAASTLFLLATALLFLFGELYRVFSAARGDARPPDLAARGDARPPGLATRGDARPPGLAAREDARPPGLAARGDARPPNLAARGDARPPGLAARGDARPPDLAARGDARPPGLAARGDARPPRGNAYDERGADGFLGYAPFAGDAIANVRQLFFFLNGLAVYGCLYLTLNAAHHLWLIASLLLLALGYGCSALCCEYRRRDDNSFIARALLLALGAVTLACWHYLAGFPRICTIMIIAVAVTALGIRLKRRYLLDAGLGLEALACLAIFFVPLLYAWDPIQSYLPLFNLRVLALLSAILGLAATQRMLHGDKQYADMFSALWQYAWSILVFLLLAFEVNDCFRRLLAVQHSASAAEWAGAAHYLALGLVLILAAAPFMKIGWSRECRPLALTGFLANLAGIAFLGVVMLLGSDYPYVVTLVTHGTVLLPVLGVLLLLPKLLQRTCPKMPAFIPPVQYLAAFVLGFEAVSWGIWNGVTWLAVDCHIHFALDAGTLHLLLLGIAWVLFALPAAYLALCKQYTVLLYPAFAVALGGWLLVTASSFGYTPLREFHLLFNLRALALVLPALLLLLLRRLARSNEAREGQLTGWRQAFYVLAALSGFQLIGVELIDYADLLLFKHAALFAGTPEIACGLLMAGCWSLYALCLAWIALRRRFTPLLVTALLIFCVGVCVTLYCSFCYQPVGPFVTAWNLHALAMLGVAACIVLMERQVKRGKADFAWLAPFPGVLQVSTAIFLYCLVAQETWFAYSGSIDGTLSGALLTHAQNTRQAALSIASILFALGALGFGFLRRMRNVRITALVIFFAVILKVFLYDLSLLETVYRIISFIGLGVLLLAASYLYHRYRHRLGQLVS